jgi:hypothetical protein
MKSAMDALKAVETVSSIFSSIVETLTGAGLWETLKSCSFARMMRASATAALEAVETDSSIFFSLVEALTGVSSDSPRPSSSATIMFAIVWASMSGVMALAGGVESRSFWRMGPWPSMLDLVGWNE